MADVLAFLSKHVPIEKEVGKESISAMNSLLKVRFEHTSISVMKFLYRLEINYSEISYLHDDVKTCTKDVSKFGTAGLRRVIITYGLFTFVLPFLVLFLSLFITNLKLHLMPPLVA